MNTQFGSFSQDSQKYWLTSALAAPVQVAYKLHETSIMGHAIEFKPHDINGAEHTRSSANLNLLTEAAGSLKGVMPGQCAAMWLTSEAPA